MDKKEVTIPYEVALALYRAFLNPKKDREDNAGYWVSLNLASEYRSAVGDKVKC